MNSSIKSYWDKYYLSKNKINLPTQFASFVALELKIIYKINNIVEFGSGNFRDTFFFIDYNFNVTAVDPSSKLYKKHKKIKFFKLNFQDYFNKKHNKINQPTCFYGRFFFHAINLNEQIYFIELSTNDQRKIIRKLIIE